VFFAEGAEGRKEFSRKGAKVAKLKNEERVLTTKSAKGRERRRRRSFHAKPPRSPSFGIAH
jgi:hypothetical protein